MKFKIWKYDLPATPGHHLFKMAYKAEILSVQPQYGRISIWFRVFPSLAADEFRYFHVVMTGEEFSLGSKQYLGTCQFEKGDFTLHVFEEFPEGDPR